MAIKNILPDHTAKQIKEAIKYTIDSVTIFYIVPEYRKFATLLGYLCKLRKLHKHYDKFVRIKSTIRTSNININNVCTCLFNIPDSPYTYTGKNKDYVSLRFALFSGIILTLIVDMDSNRLILYSLHNCF